MLDMPEEDMLSVELPEVEVEVGVEEAALVVDISEERVIREKELVIGSLIEAKESWSIDSCRDEGRVEIWRVKVGSGIEREAVTSWRGWIAWEREEKGGRER